MDRNSNHFPTLLVVCILMSIFLYIISNVIYFFHHRKTARASITTGVALPSEVLNEEEQDMANYLKEQEDI